MNFELVVITVTSDRNNEHTINVNNSDLCLTEICSVILLKFTNMASAMFTINSYNCYIIICKKQVIADPEDLLHSLVITYS